MYIVKESNQNVAEVTVEDTVEVQKISGTYHLIGDRSRVSLKYFDLNTENPQGRIIINGLEMESQPYPDAEAEFVRIVDAAAAECKATQESFLNLSDIDLKPKRRAARKADTATQAPETPVETETPTETESS